MNAIEVKNVTYYYPDGSLGVKNVSLKIGKGDRVALVGANGSGKSTLILLMAGLIKPTVGEVRIFGKNIDEWDFKLLRRNIGVLFQNPDDFLFNPTVRDELLYTPSQLGIPKDEAMRMLKDYAKAFGLEQILNKPPFRLSGGEKKKVALACVVMLKPKILLLDEPTANVDGKTRRKIIEIVNGFDGTIVVATHELDIIPNVADRVIVMGMNKTVMAEGGLELLEDKDLLEKVCIL
jgi:cobalt/nickel transport system ATP-binding protein